MNSVKYKGPSKILLKLCDAVNALMTDKQDSLVFDEKPTKDSSNPVTSDGIYTSLIHQDTSGKLVVTVDGKKYEIEGKEV